jgi:hypothetical protein
VQSPQIDFQLPVQQPYEAVIPDVTGDPEQAVIACRIQVEQDLSFHKTDEYLIFAKVHF